MSESRRATRYWSVTRTFPRRRTPPQGYPSLAVLRVLGVVALVALTSTACSRDARKPEVSENVGLHRSALTSSVIVTVADTSGAPGADKLVLVRGESGSWVDAAYADDDGHVTFSLDEGAYSFAVLGAGSGFYFWSGEDDHCAVPGCTAATITTTIPVSVSVTDGDGTPIEDAHVIARDADGDFVNIEYTDSSGIAVLSVDAGTSEFTVSYGGILFASGACVVPGCTTKSIVVTEVAVTAVDANGTPVSGAQVIAVDAEDEYANVDFTDAEGHVKLAVPPGAYHFVSPRAGIFFQSGAPGSCVVPSCHTATIVIPPPVTVAVVDTDGQPVGDVYVVARDGDDHNVASQYAPDGVAEVNVPAGAYRFVVREGINYFSSGPPNHCEVPGCDTATVVVNKPVHVSVVDSLGQPISGVTLQALIGTAVYPPSMGNATTDGMGVASFVLPSGSYRFEGFCENTPFFSGAPASCTIPGCVTASITLQCGQCEGLADGTTCSDHNACTTVDTCDDQVCTGGSPITCDPPDQCHQGGVCEPTSGQCVYLAKADGTSCDDGDPATGADSCQAGACSGVPAGPCAGEPDYSSCDDNDACTEVDYCLAGVCHGDQPKICNPGGDECETSCNPTTGACTAEVAPDGRACEDGYFCTTGDICHSGACIAGGPVECETAACFGPGVCSEMFGGCSYPQLAAGTACDDQSACTLGDTCESTFSCDPEFGCFSAFGCVSAESVVCTTPNVCLVASCEPETGACVDTPKSNGVACDDSNGCTESDACQSGSCVGVALTCLASDGCHDGGTCNPATGECSQPAKADGTSCDDGRACSTADTCHAGVCTGAPVANCGIVAPPIDPTIARDFAAETSFLYSGANPVQTGVASGAIEPLRVGVIHGRVLDRQNQPVVDATITIHGHPEFGTTNSLDDGRYFLALNGGGTFSVEIEGTGKLPAQRQVIVPTRDYIEVPDVVLIGLDTNATIVDLPSSSTAVVQGGIMSDADGTRQATLIVPEGTTATMINADGTTTELTRMTVRSTEYTVGANGPAAMPGMLPPTSAYTYAVENSVDEALASGAKSVTFNQPIPQYVDNFLDLPTGTIVPSGYYDRERAAWVAAPNGVVVKVVDIAAGLAELDTDGDELPDDSATLSALGVTDDERVQLAALFVPGHSAWRVPLTHFTPSDYNFPPQKPVRPKTKKVKEKEKKKDPCDEDGSIIECENQVLGERLPIVGTPFTLNYRSSRTDGDFTNRTLDIPIESEEMPNTLARIDVKVEEAGVTTTASFPPVRGSIVTYTSPGKDVFGRQTQGVSAARVTIGYVYPISYAAAADEPYTFGSLTDGSSLAADRTTGEFVMTQVHESRVGGLSQRDADKMGGWSISVHHRYEPERKILHLGTGKDVDAYQIARVVTRTAGSGINENSGDGGPAVDASIRSSDYGTVGPDGSLYFSTSGGSGENVVRRITPDGTITTFAGAGSRALDDADGHPAAQAHFTSVSNPTYGLDGSIYLLAATGTFPNDLGVLWRVGPDGILHHVAGRFSRAGSASASGPAAEAELLAWSIAVASDGTVYLLEDNPDGGRWIRRISTAGFIAPYAGTGQDTYSSEDGAQALNATLNVYNRITVDATGRLYFTAVEPSQMFSSSGATYARIRKIDTDGILSTVAYGFFDHRLCSHDYIDGPVATSFNPDPNTVGTFYLPEALTATPDGTLYFSQACDTINGDGPVAKGTIHRLGTDGVLTTVAGGATRHDIEFPPAADMTNATAWALQASMLVPATDGVYFSGHNFGYDALHGSYIYKIGDPLPGIVEAGQELRIPADDGSEVYVFDHQGRHLRTENARTASTRYSFAYSAGFLTSITDADGLVTTIERDTAGQATAVVSPTGQRTAFTPGPGSYLASVTNPALETTSFTYDSNGLLKTETDAAGVQHEFVYDAMGRLATDTRPANGSWTLDRIETATGTKVVMTSAEGRVSSKESRSGSAGIEQTRISTDAAGLRGIATTDAAGTQTQAMPNGTVVTTTVVPDPRFGMAAPLESSQVTKLPSGLKKQTSAARTVQIDSGTQALLSQVDTYVSNGRTTVAAFSGATRTTTITSPMGRVASILEDDKQRPVLVSQPGLPPTSLHYDTRGRLESVTSGSGLKARTATFSYDAFDRPFEAHGPALSTISATYDDADRPITATDASGSLVSFGRDSTGRIRTVQPSGQPSHSLTYTDAGDEESYSPPAIVGTGSSTGTYDRDRKLTSILKPDGTAIAIGRDSAGRAHTVTFAPWQTGASIVNTYTYDSTSGNLHSVVTSEGESLTVGYDGALPTGVTWQGPISGNVSRTYNSDFRVASESVNGANSIAIAYDDDGLINSLGAFSVAYEPGTARIGATTLGAIAETRASNDFAEFTDTISKFGSTDLYSAHYDRDNLGRVETVTETIGGVGSEVQYSYDPTGRLWQVMRNGSLAATYEYDPNGNMETRTDISGVTIATFDVQDRLSTSGAWTYSYSANGERTRKHNTSTGEDTQYWYDGAGNLRRVLLPDGREITYEIDGFGRRIGKRVNGALVRGWLYGGMPIPVAELDGTGAVVSRLVAGQYLARGGINYRIISSDIGSPRLIVRADTGEVAQRIEYDEWGKVVSDTAPGFQSLGFAGGLYDPDTGLVHFSTREYDPEVGRWLSKDKVGFRGGSGNLYAYVGSDPINRTDPSGLDPFHYAILRWQLIWGDFTTDPNQAIFYNGKENLNRALRRAICSGKQTIFDTPGGQELRYWIDKFSQHKGWLSPQEKRSLWTIASADFARNASGTIEAIVAGGGDAYDYSGIMWNTEVARVEDNVRSGIDVTIVYMPFDEDCQCKKK